MPDYLLATLHQVASALQRCRSTATVGDRAGEHLADAMLHHHQQEQGACEGGERRTRLRAKS